MSQSPDSARGSGVFADPAEPRLPRRDLIILPLISLLTIAICLLISEGVSRLFLAHESHDTCQIDDDNIGFRYRPHCTSRLKLAEGPWVTNAYNDCGYRTKEPCAPRPPGTTRIALMGSSVSEGLNIPYDQTFAERTARGLAQALGRPVEVQNMGRIDASPINVFKQIDEALSLKPNLIIMAIDPYDIEHTDPAQIANRYKPIAATHGIFEVPATFDKTPLKRIEMLAKESTTAIAAAHFLFQNSATYVRIFLHYGDHADYLRTPLTPIWQQRLQGFEVLLAEMAARARAQHVPFVLVEAPSLAQVSVSRMQPPPPGLDADQLNNALEQLAARHGVQFVNVLDAFRNGPPPHRTFYVVDTHLNAAGQKIMSDVLLTALLQQQRSALTQSNSAPAPLPIVQPALQKETTQQ